MRVAVYSDEGCGESVTPALIHSLAPHCEYVFAISAEEILAADDLAKHMDVLAMPGGADVPYTQKLNGAGNQNIRRFVENGGRYLGLCAGAYYACRQIEWDKGDAGEICGTRELGFFPGTATGPIYPYDETLKTASLVSVDGAQIYYHGGPYFAPDEDAQGYEVLARYDVDGRIAAVRCPVGRGRAVLCAVHPEVSVDNFFMYFKESTEYFQAMHKKLQQHEDKRQGFWNKVLAALMQ